jgi:hypothetical protein
MLVVLALVAAGCRPEDGERQAAASDAPTADTAAPPLTAAEPDTLPYVVLSPALGAVWREGTSHVIRWTARRPGAVNIGAAMGGKDRGHLVFDVPADADSLRWTVPPGFVTGFGPARSDAVRIRIEDAGDPRIGVESAPFSVVGTPR